MYVSTEVQHDRFFFLSLLLTVTLWEVVTGFWTTMSQFFKDALV
jgi:hypothetical protein